MKSLAGGVRRIGDVRVDPALDEICRDGKVTKLEPRTMRLLVCLAEHAGEVLSVDQLLTEVWRDVIVGSGLGVPSRGEFAADPGRWPESPCVHGQCHAPGLSVAGSGDPLVGTPRSCFPVTSSGPGCRPAATRATVSGRHASPGARSVHSWAAADRSVAVLPFLDLSEKHDEGYFADGMSEELIDMLARVPDLRVPARTSSFYFKGKQATLSDIAKALVVSHVLEGSVRKSGDTLRITAQLIRVDTGYHEWSEAFDGPMADVFKVQDEIASEVTRVLKISLLHSPRPPPTANVGAYALYLKARALEMGGNPDDYALAEKYIQQSLVLDPTFAPAWADLAQIIVAGEGWSSRDSYVEACSRGRKAIDEALKLSAAISDSHRVPERPRARSRQRGYAAPIRNACVVDQEATASQGVLSGARG